MPNYATDPVVGVIDRTAELHGVGGVDHAPDAEGPPTVCVVPGLNEIAFRDGHGHLHDLRRYAPGDTATSDLTNAAGAPRADKYGIPHFYVDTLRNAMILLYLDGNPGNVHSLNWSTAVPTPHKLAPDAVGTPVGYYVPATDTHHVIYRDKDGHLQEVQWVGEVPPPAGPNAPRDLTAGAAGGPAPNAAGDPTAFFDGSFNHAVYRTKGGSDGDFIHELYWNDVDIGQRQLSVLNLEAAVDSDPFGYYTAHNKTSQVVYCTYDGLICELYWVVNGPVQHWLIMPTGGNPDVDPIGTLAAYYSAGTNTKHVFYRSKDGELHEIWWDAKPQPTQPTTYRVNLTRKFGAPFAAYHPAAFWDEETNTHHVVYWGEKKHIYELIWAPTAPAARTLFVTSQPQPPHLWHTSIQAAIEEAKTMNPVQGNPVSVIIYPGTYAEFDPDTGLEVPLKLLSWVFLSSASTDQNAVTIDAEVTWTPTDGGFEVVQLYFLNIDKTTTVDTAGKGTAGGRTSFILHGCFVNGLKVNGRSSSGGNRDFVFAATCAPGGNKAFTLTSCLFEWVAGRLNGMTFDGDCLFRIIGSTQIPYNDPTDIKNWLVQGTAMGVCTGSNFMIDPFAISTSPLFDKPEWTFRPQTKVMFRGCSIGKRNVDAGAQVNIS